MKIGKKADAFMDVTKVIYVRPLVV